MNRFFGSIVRPLLEELAPQVIVEVGADRGAHTELLLAHAAASGAALHAVDPAPGFDPEALAARYPGRLTFHRAPSLVALAQTPPPDLVLLDGDHNWHTVRGELELLARRAREEARPFPAVLLHDVAWPYARRDMYYDPAAIPAERRQPYARGGLAPGEPGLSPQGGVNEHLHNAEREGGPRNGVLTAVEDFLGDPEAPRDLALLSVPVLNGLGILFREEHRQRSPHLARLAEQLAPEGALRALLEAVEEQRNVDAVTLARQAAALERTQRAVEEARGERDRLAAELARTMELVRAAHAQLAAIWRSPTWRVTRPLRAVEQAARAARDRLRPPG